MEVFKRVAGFGSCNVSDLGGFCGDVLENYFEFIVWVCFEIIFFVYFQNRMRAAQKLTQPPDFPKRKLYIERIVSYLTPEAGPDFIRR
jgi:hypothetical protein